MKFGNFIKRTLASFLLLLMFSTPMIAHARPGGGGGGGGGSSGGGGGSSSSHGGTSHGGSSGRAYSEKSDPVRETITFVMFALASSAGIIVFKARLVKKKSESISAIKNLSRNDDNWNYEHMKKDIEDAFYKVGIAWMERDQDLAREYMSDRLYDKHKMQTEWMKVRKEKNILKDMTLLGATPVGLKDCEGTDRDSIWVHIKADSIDYIVNEETGEVLEGHKFKPVYYEEYWKFIKKDGRWVLDEIRQTNDITDLNFFEIDVDDKNE